MLNEYSSDQDAADLLIRDDKKLFLEVLDEIIEERKKTGESFYDIENEQVMPTEEYYENILLEMKRLSDEIFADKDFIEEQFGHYDNFRDYINDIINDIVKEDSISSSPFNCTF